MSDWLTRPIQGPMADALSRTLRWSLVLVVIAFLLVAGDVLWRLPSYYGRESMERNIRRLVIVQDTLFSVGGRYVSNVDSLRHHWTTLDGVGFDIWTSPQADGWSARFQLVGRGPPITCVIYVGSVEERPRTLGGLRPSSPRERMCDSDRPLVRRWAIWREARSSR